MDEIELDDNEARERIFEVCELLTDTYEVGDLLGEGGMGQVFEAKDVILGRKVAVKAAFSHINPGALRKEAKALAALRHSSMVTVHAFGVHRGIDYLVMERVYGVSLEAYLDQRGLAGSLMTVQEVTDVLRALAEGLMVVHRAGIVHRDIKPGNIMLAPGNRIVLMDFGLFLAEFEMNQQKLVAGSPQYMAPESIENRMEPGMGHLVDLYALGVVGFEMLTGDVPFTGESVEEVWDQHVQDEPPRVSHFRDDVPPRLERLIDQLMAKDPRERPQSAEGILWELTRIEKDKGQDHSAKLDVLIVDDDEQIARMLALYVKKIAPHATIRTEGDGEKALAAIRTQVPDLMLLDLNMPRMNGIELVMHIRGTRIADKCTIVSLSAAAQQNDVQLLHSLGVDRFVPKGAALLRTVAQVVRELVARDLGLFPRQIARNWARRAPLSYH